MIDFFASIGFLVFAYYIFIEFKKYREKNLEYKRIEAIHQKAINLGVDIQYARIINYARNSSQAAYAFHDIVQYWKIKTDLCDVFDKLGSPDDEIVKKIPELNREDLGIDKAIEEMKKKANLSTEK